MHHALDRQLTVRLDTPTFSALAEIAERELSTPALVARDWIRERLGTLPDLFEFSSPLTGSAENPREKLRRSYLPKDVPVLFVGESAPAGNTFFYEANSNLFRAVRDACARAYGDVPAGKAFLKWFQDQGFWLWDLAKRPVNRQRGRPRKLEVSQGVMPLARVLRELDPDFVVAVGQSLEPSVRAAAELAHYPRERLRVLPFPLYQWREQFVDQLAQFLGPAANREKTAMNAD